MRITIHTRKAVATHKKATTTHKKTTTKKPATTTHKTVKSTSTTTTGGLSGAAILAALRNDPTALQTLTGDVASNLFSGGFTAEIIDAVTQVMQVGRAHGPGRRIAGTVSSAAGGLQGGYGSGSPRIAMVYLGGAATAVPCYVPPHLAPHVQAGVDVWVEPVNGSISDLMVVTVRGFTGMPASSAVIFAASVGVWSGQTFTAQQTQTLDFSTGSIVPTTARAVLLWGQIDASGSSQGNYLQLQSGTSATSGQFVVGPVPYAGSYAWGQGWVALDANKKASAYLNLAGHVTLTCMGYLL